MYLPSSPPPTPEASTRELELVLLKGIYGELLYLPWSKCFTMDQTRLLLAKIFDMDEADFAFYMGMETILAETWNERIGPGKEVDVRLSQSFGDRFRYHLSQRPHPIPPITQPIEFSDIWHVGGGLFRLREHDQTFQIMPNSNKSSLLSLDYFKNLRARAYPETWSDLGGDKITGGSIGAVIRPQVNVGPVLTGSCNLGDVLYVLIWKGVLQKGTNGDSAHKWAGYPSLEHAQESLKENLRTGNYSLEACWAEINTPTEDEKFIGQTFGNTFAVIDVKKEKKIGLHGCTFPGCYETFCNPSDWRHHEKATHFQLESWICMPCVRNRADGPWMFVKEEMFQKHAYQHKGMNLDSIMKEGHIGRNHQQSFWCGFCKKPVHLKQKRNEAWDERFRHIEHHFHEGRTIQEWLCPEEKGHKKFCLELKDKIN
ncbi:hypothetical protein GQ44DRAFT_778907 [Phaeosphaeriaceae sp. PMI808]|nr:hypothetical protein GQ44DRAFT_778907 [Phaeosphaeriaceae sp. PMI808]